MARWKGGGALCGGHRAESKKVALPVPPGELGCRALRCHLLLTTLHYLLCLACPRAQAHLRPFTSGTTAERPVNCLAPAVTLHRPAAEASPALSRHPPSLALPHRPAAPTRHSNQRLSPAAGRCAPGLLAWALWPALLGASKYFLRYSAASRSSLSGPPPFCRFCCLGPPAEPAGGQGVIEMVRHPRGPQHNLKRGQRVHAIPAVGRTRRLQP